MSNGVEKCRGGAVSVQSFLSRGWMITEKRRKKATNVAGLAAAVLLCACLCLLRTDGGFYQTLPPRVEGVTLSEQPGEDRTLTFAAQVSPPTEMRGYDGYRMWACIRPTPDAPPADGGGWVEVTDGQVEFSVGSGEWYICTLDSFGNVGSSLAGTVEINEVVDVSLSDGEIYLASEGGEYTLVPEVTVIGSPDETLTWTSSDPSIATVDENGVVKAAGGVGRATVTAACGNGISASASVVCTDYITLPVINNTKTKLGYDIAFTEEEAEMLDNALFWRVDGAGYGTRAGVVAAARFLALEFCYRVPYFYENGRLHLDEYTRHYCDGEGRFYHRGLYLTESKYDLLDPDGIRYGPAHWGAPLTNWEDAAEKGFAYGQRYPNGLDCSGFVTWCLVNGGVDVGDVGAGDYVYRDDELCDLGTREYITLELMQSGRVKAGDLIGKDGHIAIIIGIDNENVYIAESLYSGVVVATKQRFGDILYAYLYDYIMLMDDEYDGDGNYAAYWEPLE